MLIKRIGCCYDPGCYSGVSGLGRLSKQKGGERLLVYTNREERNMDTTWDENSLSRSLSWRKNNQCGGPSPENTQQEGALEEDRNWGGSRHGRGHGG